MGILGSCLTPMADSDRAVQFALSRGRAHWVQRRLQLCRKRVLLRKRIDRYYATVALTVLHGLEGVPLTQALLRDVMSFDRRNLKSMLGARKRAGETWQDFGKRQNRFLRRFMEKIGATELVARLLAKQHGWAGHVSRLPAHHVAAEWAQTGTLEHWHLTQAVYSTLDAKNSLSWRHASKGPKTHWETNLMRVYGDNWRPLTADRKSWRRGRARFISDLGDDLLGRNARLFGVSCTPSAVAMDGVAVSHALPCDVASLPANEVALASIGNLFVERGVAKAALEQLSNGFIIQYVGDSSFLIDCLLGRASSQLPDLHRSISLAHTALQTVMQSLHAEPPDSAEFGLAVPRGDNSAADAAANWALDQGSFMDCRAHEVAKFVQAVACGEMRGLGLLFSFDGASRGNPGPSASGACAWWGSFLDGSFQPHGLLMQKGARLGTGTNNRAEAHGLATAAKMSVHFVFRVVEQLAQLSQHSVSLKFYLTEFKHKPVRQHSECPALGHSISREK